MKRDLHTLYIKHDGQFKTLSKIALSQLILKIVHLKGDGTLLRQIEAELSTVLASPVSKSDIEEATRVLAKARKLNIKSNRCFIHNDYKEELNKEIESNKNLLSKTLNKYFSKAESKKKDIEDWFNDAVICFFEKYSFEWFQQVAYKNKNGSNNIININEILDSSLLNNSKIVEADKSWLKVQFIKFIESEEPDDSLLFWYYGISMFSARLITARNYADGISIDMFRDSKFILDTNILMILDLEEHALSTSLKSLENILIQLNITPVYFNITRDEYTRAMHYRKTETTKVFDSFNLSVLRSSDCPFIQTALRRGCISGEDVERMFENLMEMPSIFNERLPITVYDFAELSIAVDDGVSNDNLKSKINAVYKKLTRRDKREAPINHDAGLVSGAQYIRKSERCWIITSDSVMKRYAIENCLRDENEVAVGLDVVIGLMAVNSGGANLDASNFAPLFKNLIKYSLIPESDAFEVKDLAFILRTNIKVNELSNEKVIDVAKEVKRLRIAGEEEENIALYLRRFMEGDTLSMYKEIEEAHNLEVIAMKQKEVAEKERDALINEFRERRRGELRDKYDNELRNNRLMMLILPIIIGIIVFMSIKYGLDDERNIIQYIIGCSVEIIFGLLPLIPWDKRLLRKHSEYVQGINRIVENEIIELKKRGNDGHT